jgi:hypothetical protein
MSHTAGFGVAASLSSTPSGRQRFPKAAVEFTPVADIQRSLQPPPKAVGWHEGSGIASQELNAVRSR